MTLEEFQTLSEESQLAAVFASGTFVATRWQEEHEAVHPYEMPSGFLAEITYNTTKTRCFIQEALVQTTKTIWKITACSCACRIGCLEPKNSP